MNPTLTTFHRRRPRVKRVRVLLIPFSFWTSRFSFFGARELGTFTRAARARWGMRIRVTYEPGEARTHGAGVESRVVDSAGSTKFCQVSAWPLGRAISVGARLDHVSAPGPGPGLEPDQCYYTTVNATGCSPAGTRSEP